MKTGLLQCYQNIVFVKKNDDSDDSVILIIFFYLFDFNQTKDVYIGKKEMSVFVFFNFGCNYCVLL